MAKGQRQRTQKVSKGTARGSQSVQLTEGEKIRFSNGGLLAQYNGKGKRCK